MTASPTSDLLRARAEAALKSLDPHCDCADFARFVIACLEAGPAEPQSAAIEVARAALQKLRGATLIDDDGWFPIKPTELAAIIAAERLGPAEPIPVNTPGPCPHGKPWLTYCPECEADARWRDSNEPQIPDQGPAEPTRDTSGWREIASVYVASRVKRAPMWREIRDAKAIGIVSSWIDEAGEGETADLGELWQRIFGEVSAASALILYAETEDFPLKGALVEVGMALALGKPIFAVLPGVVLEPRSMRPVGSWLHHPNVRRAASLTEAFAELRALPPPPQGQTL
jgi:hypothetical protein